MKRKAIFLFSILFLISALCIPAFSGGGMIEWPCTLISFETGSGIDYDCVGWNTDCICIALWY